LPDEVLWYLSKSEEFGQHGGRRRRRRRRQGCPRERTFADD
jgi:hypothetical protein